MDEKNKDIIENSDIIGEENITDDFLSGNVEEKKLADNFNNTQNLEEESFNNLEEENLVNDIDEIDDIDNTQKVNEDIIDDNKSQNFTKDDIQKDNQDFNKTNNSKANDTKNEIKEKLNDFTKSAKPVFDEIFEKAKIWFSNDPFEVFSSKLSKQATFTIFGISIFVFLITSLLKINSFISLALPFFIDSRFVLILPLLIISVAFYGLLALAVKLLLTYLKGTKTDYISSLELVALNTIPTFVISFIGLVLGLIYLPLFLLTTLISLTIYVIGIYEGLRKYLGVNEKSIFWPFMIGHSTFAIVMALVFRITIALLIRNSMFFSLPF